MFQTSIDVYNKYIENNLSEYLASMPNPFEPLDRYVIPSDDKCNGFPIEWFDIAAVTALIRNHKDAKSKYEVNSYLVEMLSSMFKIANEKLGWLTDANAAKLAMFLSYDRNMDDEYIEVLHELIFCITRFPYSIEQQVWYAYLMPLLAYTNPKCIYAKSISVLPNYLARHFVSIINKYGILANTGEHIRDVNIDALKSITTLSNILLQCQTDVIRTNSKYKYDYYLKVIREFAIIYLSCLLQRSAINEAFGKIGAEIVSYHYIEYQEISQQYFNKKKSQEI